MPSQVQVSGGLLQLVADETPTPGTTTGGAAKVYPWTSGMVTTYGKFDFTYGYVQVVAKLPSGDGFWPALWLLPQSETWPPEIDIMENWGTYPNSLWFTNHLTPSEYSTYNYASGSGYSQTFHTYAVDWEPGSITWYLDGQQVFQVTTGVPDQPMYFIANLAVDGASGLAPDGSTPPSASFEIKSVSIWQH